MKKRKLLIFILLILLKYRQTYATLYPDQNNHTDPRRNHLITNEIIKPGDLNGNTVISVQPNKYAILLGKGETDNPVIIEIEHSGNNVKKILNINSKMAINNFTVNRGILKGINKSNFNFEVVSIQEGKFRNEGIIEVSGNKGTGINVTNKAVIENTGEIFAKNRAKGIFLNYNDLQFKNTGKITVTGQGSIGITGNKNKKADILSDKTGIMEVRDKAIGVSLENKMFFKNEGQINVFSNENLTSGSEAIGVNINSEERNSFENHGVINVSGTGKSPYSGYNAKGIFINSEKGSAVNFFRINAYNTGIGVISKGYFENNGIISANGKSIGINILKTGTVSTEKTVNNSIISAGKESYGVQLAGNANFENSETGSIYVSEGSTGIIAAKETKKGNNGSIVNKGKIFVSDDKSTGIQANDHREIVTEGTVEVEGGKFTSGIKASGKNSLLINKGKIIHKGDNKNTSGAAVSQMRGTIENKGEIEVLSGKLSSAIAISENSFGINAETGKISINEGTGIKISKNGMGINRGEIILNNGNATGVQLSDSVFINDSGKIVGNSSEASVSSRPLTNNTVLLKNNSSINGKIKGNTGVDALFLDNLVSWGINAEKYNSLNITGKSYIKDSEISLESHEEAKKYTEEKRSDLEQKGYINGQKGTLTMENSTLVLNKKNNVPIYVNGKSIILKGKTNLSFKGEGKEFSVSEYLGGIKVDGSEAQFEDSLVWSHRKKEDRDVVLEKNKYSDIAENKNLSEFIQYLETERNKNKTDGDLDKIIGKMELLKDKSEFNNVLAQLSGVAHAYVLDAGLINSKIIEDISLKKAFLRNHARRRPLNSSAHEISYLDSTDNLTGAMKVTHKEKGIMGVWEKQIIQDNRLGTVYGVSKGNINFGNNGAGNANMDTIYFGGYYDYLLNSRISFLTTAGVTYSHASVKREVNIDDKNYSFNSGYPLITFGAGSKIIYTPVDRNMFRISMYAGVDFKKIFQGNINEDRETAPSKASNLTIKNVPVSEKYYNSITPVIGINIEKTGFLMNRVYRLGIGAGYETELGNINKFKSYKLQGLLHEHKVKSTNFKNMFYYTMNMALDLTENLSLTANYRHVGGKGNKSDKIGVGFEYKADSLFKDNILNTAVSKLNNGRKNSEWKKTVGFTLEAEDPSDRDYYYGNILSSGDYSKSADYKPLIWMTLRNEKSKISYYFEGFYKSNTMFQKKSRLEDKVSSNRLLGEIRYRNNFSRGSYGISAAYKAENSVRPKNYAKKDYSVSRSGFHELRLDVSFSYNLGNGYLFNGKTTGMTDLFYKGERKNQKDYKLENQYGFVYNGFLPKWRMQVMYFRDDRWFDRRNNAERYKSEQLRPAVTYNFGNGDSVTFDFRLPLGKGAGYTTAGTKEKKAETYEYRYGIRYNKSIMPGLNVFASVSISDIKVKNTDYKSARFGETARNHVFRPSIGINFSF